MHAKFRDRLPNQLRLLVDEIETAAGTEIAVFEGSAYLKETKARAVIRVGTEAHSSGGLDLAIECEDMASTDSAYPVPYAIFCHELLHLRRYYVDRVPSVMGGSFRRITESTDKTISFD